MLSGIQHFRFCRRQWALIHIENQWQENYRTTEGQLMHKRAHDGNVYESRGDMIIMRGLKVFSHSLGISGNCDVVEFHRVESGGVTLQKREGEWLPYPVEYKRGKPKENNADILQLCAQAMCLEEMLCCDIPRGAIYYGETRHRLVVEFTDELRDQLRSIVSEMRAIAARGHTPQVKPTKGCNACSLKDICLPKMNRCVSVGRYLSAAEEE